MTKNKMTLNKKEIIETVSILHDIFEKYPDENPPKKEEMPLVAGLALTLLEKLKIHEEQVLELYPECKNFLKKIELVDEDWTSYN